MTSHNRSYATFEAFLDKEFPQWRFSNHSETVDAVRWMRRAWDAGHASHWMERAAHVKEWDGPSLSMPEDEG